MIFPVYSSFVGDISMVGDLNDLELRSRIEKLSRLTIYNFPKNSNSITFG